MYKLGCLNGETPEPIKNPKNRTNSRLLPNKHFIEQALNSLTNSRSLKFIIRVIKCTDIIGLEDSIELKKRYTNVKCTSITGELYRISIEVMHHLI
jgi:hypothetical protein